MFIQISDKNISSLLSNYLFLSLNFTIHIYILDLYKCLVQLFLTNSKFLKKKLTVIFKSERDKHLL